LESRKYRRERRREKKGDLPFLFSLGICLGGRGRGREKGKKGRKWSGFIFPCFFHTTWEVRKEGKGKQNSIFLCCL